MSNGDNDPYQRHYLNQYGGPEQQHNGFIDPQQLMKPPVNYYAPPDRSSYPYNAQSSAPFSSAPQYNATPQAYVPQPLQQVAEVRIPSYQPLPPQSTHKYGLDGSSYHPQPAHVPNRQDGFSSKSTAAMRTTAAPPVESRPLVQPLDYQQLLLSMAEEYLTAAYRYGAISDLHARQADRQEYYKLITTGLGCLEALLKHYKLKPEVEANVRWRYSTILYEETENTMEAEESLSKGISLCDRHRFDDLKYNMQYTSTKILFSKNPRAAYKYLDRCIADAEAYQHIAWMYAFRFLKVALHLELSSRQDLTFALSQLRTISSLAKEQGETLVAVFATAMEVLISLRDNRDSGGFEQAQHALASLKKFQLDPALNENPRMTVLSLYADLACRLQNFQPEEALASMKNMREKLENAMKSEEWSSGSSFPVPLIKAMTPIPAGESGVMKRRKDGSMVLALRWMSKVDIENIGYLLGGITLGHKNSFDGHKAEKSLLEGISQQASAQKLSSELPKSILQGVEEQTWREQLVYHSRLHLGFLMAARTSWTAAGEQVEQIKELNTSWPDVPNDLFLPTQYLKGTIRQGTGDLSTAIDLYDSVIHFANGQSDQPRPSQPSTPARRSLSVVERDLLILSTLNKLLIIRNPYHPRHHECSTTLSSIAPFFESSNTNQSPNSSIRCAFSVLKAIMPSSSATASTFSGPVGYNVSPPLSSSPAAASTNSILSTKQSLQNALNGAKRTSNNQLMCLVLNIMSWKFFEGVLGAQSEKSAQASNQLAKKCGDALWTAVSSGTLARTLDAAGRSADAEHVWRAGVEVMAKLPKPIQDVAERGLT